MNTILFLLMIIQGSSGMSTIKIDNLNQQSCNAIEQNIEVQANKVQAYVVAEGCYNPQDGSNN